MGDGGTLQGMPADRFRIKKSIVSGDPPVESDGRLFGGYGKLLTGLFNDSRWSITEQL